MGSQIGVGTADDSFNGTESMMQVIPSIDSLKNKRYLVSILLNTPVASRICQLRFRKFNVCVSILVIVEIAVVVAERMT